jgi:hypothetical protein
LVGRVVLINTVLASIPVFYLSFLKMPSLVRKTIVGLQRKFLWGGTSGDKEKITWVSWRDGCRPKEEGGLGVKDLKWFHTSLLTKWRWRLLVDHDSLWKKVLEAKYGGVGRGSLSLPRGNKFSLWWKDIVEIGKINGVEGDWTQLVFSKKLGCGGSTRFWLDRWVGVAPLCDTFPRLFKVSLQSESLIKDMGEWSNDIWHWKLKWQRTFFNWEEASLSHLMELIMWHLSQRRKILDHTLMEVCSPYATCTFTYIKNFSPPLLLSWI